MKKFISLVTASMLLATAIIITPFPPKEKFVDLADKVMPKCVSLELIVERKDPFTGKIQKGGIGGSGVFVSPDGYLLTCKHVVDFTYIHSITVELLNGDKVAARIISLSDSSDLALLKVDFFDRVDYAELADPRYLKVGQEVMAVGSPAGLVFSVTTGIISALYRDIGDNYNVTQSDTAINPGNSGGPLFNLRGELVGINSFFIPVTFFEPVFSGLGFSVQSGQCYQFLIDCAKKEKGFKIRKFQP
jgi:serine protease Do